MSSKTFLSRFFRATLMGALLFVGAANASNIAASNTASAVVTESAISVTADTSVPLDFGTFAPGAGGTVTIDPIQANTRRTASTNITLGAGTPNAAHFTVAGDPGRTYSITVPTTAVTLTNGAGYTMTATSFTTNKTANQSTLSGTMGGSVGTGADAFYVGATLNVGAGQQGGTYTGSYDVTVAYN